VRVTAHAIDLRDLHGDIVTLRVDCSAGFYVRSLAHDLGVRLGTGAHLAALRRTRSGDFTLQDSVALDALERDRDGAVTRFVPLAGMLRGFSSVVLTADGAKHACHGRDLGPADLAPESSMPADVSDTGADAEAATGEPGLRWVRLLDRDGALLGLARQATASRVLHPSVVLV
jgi:tRNA pseudouridine55 synthase